MQHLHFHTLLLNYPQGDATEVKKMIGGQVNSPEWANTCAIRMSRSFNLSRDPVPAHHPGLIVVKGADKMNYALRQLEFRHWLRTNIGDPSVVKRGRAGTIHRSSFKGKKGIIGFDIHFSDCNGHLDLWDGTAYTHAQADPRDYFRYASRVELWVLK